MKPTELPSASLYFREGSSDKEYHARVEKRGDGFVVSFAYGRRGSTLQTGTKTQHPTSLSEATQIWQKLVAAKEAKGYQRGGNGDSKNVPAPTAQAPARPRVGALPQLLNELPEEELPAFLKLHGDSWGAQEKHDGKNLVVAKFQFAVNATNKDGQACDISLAIANEVAALDGDFTIMGEGMGERLAVHNIVEMDGHDCRPATYQSRHDVLKALIGKRKGQVFVSPLIVGAKNILAFYKKLKAANAEGMVLKDLEARHTEGRPNSGGTQFKVKFWADCSCIVGAINTARSVAVKLGDVWMGNVTIPPNHQIPPVGAVVDVKYLYAYKGGSLYQPQYRGVRDDVKPSDCTIAKQRIKFKGESKS